MKELLFAGELWSAGVPNLFGVPPQRREFADKKTPNKLGTPTGGLNFDL